MDMLLNVSQKGVFEKEREIETERDREYYFI